jgi:hypothetical protein
MTWCIDLRPMTDWVFKSAWEYMSLFRSKCFLINCLVILQILVVNNRSESNGLALGYIVSQLWEKLAGLIWYRLSCRCMDLVCLGWYHWWIQWISDSRRRRCCCNWLYALKLEHLSFDRTVPLLMHVQEVGPTVVGLRVYHHHGASQSLH